MNSLFPFSAPFTLPSFIFVLFFFLFFCFFLNYQMHMARDVDLLQHNIDALTMYEGRELVHCQGIDRIFCELLGPTRTHWRPRDKTS